MFARYSTREWGQSIGLPSVDIARTELVLLLLRESKRDSHAGDTAKMERSFKFSLDSSFIAQRCRGVMFNVDCVYLERPKKIYEANRKPNIDIQSKPRSPSSKLNPNVIGIKEIDNGASRYRRYTI